MNQHDKAREFWLYGYRDEEPGNLNVCATEVMEWPIRIHVREVLPGEICITRDEMEKILSEYADGEAVYRTLAKLWPEGPE